MDLEQFSELGNWAEKRDLLGELYDFNKDILGYDKIEEQPHRLMCDSVQYGSNRQLHLWPRGHFKTTVITIGYTLYLLAENPNLRIFIGNSVLANAKSFLREIKGHLKDNEKLKEIMGNTVNKDDKCDKCLQGRCGCTNRNQLQLRRGSRRSREGGYDSHISQGKAGPNQSQR